MSINESTISEFEEDIADGLRKSAEHEKSSLEFYQKAEKCVFSLPQGSYHLQQAILFEQMRTNLLLEAILLQSKNSE